MEDRGGSRFRFCPELSFCTSGFSGHELRARFIASINCDAGKFKEIGQQRMAMFRGDGFGMKLYTMDRMGFVSEPHDHSVITFGGDFQLGRKGCPFNSQGMIACRPESTRQTLEDAFALVGDSGQLAVHEGRRPYNLAAIGLADGLVAQAHAKYRNTGTCGSNEIEADACLIGGTGAGRKDDCGWLPVQDFFHRFPVVADDGTIGPQLTQEMDEIIGKTVVIIDQDKHASCLGEEGGAGQVLQETELWGEYWQICRLELWWC